MRKLILKVSVLSHKMLTTADVVVDTETGRPFTVGALPKEPYCLNLVALPIGD